MLCATKESLCCNVFITLMFKSQYDLKPEIMYVLFIFKQGLEEVCLEAQELELEFLLEARHTHISLSIF